LLLSLMLLLLFLLLLLLLYLLVMLFYASECCIYVLVSLLLMLLVLVMLSFIEMLIFYTVNDYFKNDLNVSFLEHCVLSGRSFKKCQIIVPSTCHLSWTGCQSIPISFTFSTLFLQVFALSQNILIT
jgi:hypothetical protein